MQFLEPMWRQRLASTNATVLEECNRQKLPEGYVLAVREQTSGRGRFDRRWISETGRDLAFSSVINYRNRVDLPSLPMAAALAVAELLRDFKLEAQTKWPNDVLVGGRKICGILAEMPHGNEGSDSSRPENVTQNGLPVVLGIGLNVNMGDKVAAVIDRPTTSMLLETGHTHSVDEVLQNLLGSLANWCGRWKHGGFAALETAWRERCYGLGTEAEIGDGDNSVRGIIEGFGERGQILLRRVDGKLSEVWSGDVELVRDS